MALQSWTRPSGELLLPKILSRNRYTSTRCQSLDCPWPQSSRLHGFIAFCFKFVNPENVLTGFRSVRPARLPAWLPQDLVLRLAQHRPENSTTIQLRDGWGLKLSCICACLTMADATSIESSPLPPPFADCSLPHVNHSSCLSACSRPSISN